MNKYDEENKVNVFQEMIEIGGQRTHDKSNQYKHGSPANRLLNFFSEFREPTSYYQPKNYRNAENYSNSLKNLRRFDD